MPSSVIFIKAAKAGISQKTLHRAKNLLKVKAQKKMGCADRWLVLKTPI